MKDLSVIYTLMVIVFGLLISFNVCELGVVQKSYIEESQTMHCPKEKQPKGETVIYNILHRKLTIEQYEPP
jgi:hypothetical protein